MEKASGGNEAECRESESAQAAERRVQVAGRRAWDVRECVLGAAKGKHVSNYEQSAQTEQARNRPAMKYMPQYKPQSMPQSNSSCKIYGKP